MSLADGMTSFNMHHAHVEALVRGLRGSFLKEQDYHHLVQCETVDDIKMNLQVSDYNTYIADEVGVSPFTPQKPSPVYPDMIRRKALQKLVDEFKYLRSQSCYPLSTFLDYLTYEYMIDNIMLLLKGTLADTSIDVNELLQQCHPLGMFKESTMASIVAFEHTSQGYADLYQVVLVDTPVGKYFAQFFKDQMRQTSNTEVRNILGEVSLAILESSILKLYLEDFYQFCQQLNDQTREIMSELLSERADQMSLNITINSFGTPLADPSLRELRKSLYPSFGALYPQGIEQLSLCDDLEAMSALMSSLTTFKDLWERTMNVGDVSIDDAFYLRAVRLLENAFQGQMHFAVFYAYVKLKEQEIRNLVWISECILQKQKQHIEKYIPLFAKEAPWRSGGTFF